VFLGMTYPRLRRKRGQKQSNGYGDTEQGIPPLTTFSRTVPLTG